MQCKSVNVEANAKASKKNRGKVGKGANKQIQQQEARKEAWERVDLMGLFGATKQYDLPPGDPQTWNPTQVKHWIKHIGMAKHKASFRVLTGEQLVKLTEQQVVEMCNKQDLDAKFVYRMLLRLKGENNPNGTTPAVAAKERAIQYLFQWAGEDASLPEFREFLDGAGTVTIGLMTSCDRMATSVLGAIVGLVFKIYKSSRVAQVNIYNCRILRYLAVDILRAFHSAGTDKLVSVPEPVFNEIKQHLEKALLLVRSCSKPGWLVRMAFAGRINEEFSGIHKGLVHALESNDLDDLYGHARLPMHGDYTDCCSSLQQVLLEEEPDLRAALVNFAETGIGYDSIKTALNCDDEGLRSEMGYIAPALAVIDKMLPPQPAASPAGPATTPAPEVLPPPMKSSSPQLTPATAYSEGAPLTPPQAKAALKVPPLKLQNTQQEVQVHLMPEDGEEDITLQATPTGIPQSSPRPVSSKPRAANVYEVFLAFCNFGTRQEVSEMDGAHFSKFCRDCKLLGKGLTSTDVDLTFTRVKPIGQRRIQYDEFVQSLSMMAEKKNIPLQVLTEEILAAGGPAVKATKTVYTRLHDDRSTYTGVYARGGPTNVDERMSLDKMVLRQDPREQTTPRMVLGGNITPRAGFDTSFSTPRSGRTQRTPRGRSFAEHQQFTPRMNYESTWNQQRSSAQIGTPPMSVASSRASKFTNSPVSVPRVARNLSHTPRGLSSRSAANRGSRAEVPWNDPDSRAELKRVFNSFAAFGIHYGKASSEAGAQQLEMENKQFVKLVKDAGLIGGSLNVTRLDIIFTKVKRKGLRKIDFNGFELALTMLAEERDYNLNQVYNAIVSTAGPALNHVTTPEFVKYHDDRNTYTGVYARGGPTNIDNRITLDKMVTRNDDVYLNKRTPRFVA